ncbi:MAG: hypothetical protein KDI83_08225 [Gammaproteobacteria bacterium]|nr:hypothetical protein [Gammaproteobacteria bacterium]
MTPQSGMDGSDIVSISDIPMLKVAATAAACSRLTSGLALLLSLVLQYGCSGPTPEITAPPEQSDTPTTLPLPQRTPAPVEVEPVADTADSVACLNRVQALETELQQLQAERNGAFGDSTEAGAQRTENGACDATEMIEQNRMLSEQLQRCAATRDESEYLQNKARHLTLLLDRAMAEIVNAESGIAEMEREIGRWLDGEDAAPVKQQVVDLRQELELFRRRLDETRVGIAEQLDSDELPGRERP